MPAASILAARLTKALEPLQLGKVNDRMANAVAQAKEEGRRKVMGSIYLDSKVGIPLKELGQFHRARTTFLTWMYTR